MPNSKSKTLHLHTEKKEPQVHSLTIESNEELMKSKIMRTSITTKNDILKGQKLTLKDLDFQRPGTGISPGKLSKILGKKAGYILINERQISIDDINDLKIARKEFGNRLK